MVNKKILGIAGLAAVALVGGTFAYFTQTDVIKNPFNTARHGSVVTESFDPSKGENWEPGVTVPKEVNVKNTGDADVLVKVAFEDIWVLSDNTEWKITDGKVFGKDGQLTYQDNKVDGDVKEDATVVAKNLDAAEWTKIGNAYYYNKKLPKGEDTKPILKSVTLDKDLDLGKTVTRIYGSTVPGEMPSTDDLGISPSNWELIDTKEGDVEVDRSEYKEKGYKHIAIVKELDTTKPGYANASYTLKITVTTVQATEDAAKEAFGYSSLSEDDQKVFEGLMGAGKWELPKKETNSDQGNQEPDPDPQP